MRVTGYDELHIDVAAELGTVYVAVVIQILRDLYRRSPYEIDDIVCILCGSTVSCAVGDRGAYAVCTVRKRLGHLCGKLSTLNYGFNGLDISIGIGYLDCHLGTVRGIGSAGYERCYIVGIVGRVHTDFWRSGIFLYGIGRCRTVSESVRTGHTDGEPAVGKIAYVYSVDFEVSGLRVVDYFRLRNYICMDSVADPHRIYRTSRFYTAG